MLINHQVKTLLPAMPLDGLQHGRTLAAAPDNFYSPRLAFRLRTGKIVCKPVNFVSAPDQFGEVGQADTLCAAGNRILRVAPVEHQKSHDGPGHSREIFSSNAVVDFPGTKGIITIFPPACSTARRSS